MVGRLATATTSVALAYSALLWFLSLYPFHRHLSPERRLLVAHGGCGLAGSIRQSIEADPEVARVFLPVIMARRLDRGEENALSDWSCWRIAEDLRRNAAWLAWVPRRFLCRDVRRYVRAAYRRALLRLGEDILVHDGEAIGTWSYYAEITRLGFAWVGADDGMRLVRRDRTSTADSGREAGPPRDADP